MRTFSSKPFLSTSRRTITAAVAAFTVVSLCAEPLTMAKSKPKKTQKSVSLTSNGHSMPYYLGRGVFSGIDISDSVPIIEGYLKSTDKKEKKDAASVLTCYYFEKREYIKLNLLLTGIDVTIRESAFESLSIYIKYKLSSDSPIIPIIFSGLSDSSVDVRKNAADILADHYFTTGNTGELALLLQHNNVEIREGAFQGLSNSFSEFSPSSLSVLLPTIISKLGDSSKDVKSSAADILVGISFRSDIPASSVDGLSKLLSDKNEFTRLSASEALTMHYIRNKDIQSISSLFDHSDESVREGVAWALLIAADFGALVSRLPALQNPKNCQTVLKAVENRDGFDDRKKPQVDLLIRTCENRIGK